MSTLIKVKCTFSNWRNSWCQFRRQVTDHLAHEVVLHDCKAVLSYANWWRRFGLVATVAQYELYVLVLDILWISSRLINKESILITEHQTVGLIWCGFSRAIPCLICLLLEMIVTVFALLQVVFIFFNRVFLTDSFRLFHQEVVYAADIIRIC